MMMETFSLADNSWQANLRIDDRNPYEIYKTRLVRVDTASRSPSGDFFDAVCENTYESFGSLFVLEEESDLRTAPTCRPRSWSRT